MNITRNIITIMSILSFLFGGCSKQTTAPIAMSDKELLVRGWSDSELRQILGDFQRLSGDRLPSTYSTEIHSTDGAALRVTFPADIPSMDFCFIVNYVQYPNGFDLNSGVPILMLQAERPSLPEFLPSDQSLVGKRITWVYTFRATISGMMRFLHKQKARAMSFHSHGRVSSEHKSLGFPLELVI